MMSVERKHIIKPFLLLCEGRDAEGFLIQYLNSKELSQDQRLSNDIQVFDFGGNEELSNFLMNLKNMDKFDQVTSLAIIRDAEKDYAKACKEVSNSLEKCGFISSERCGIWAQDEAGLKIGFMLFPLDGNAGTLEDLCLRILAEKNSASLLSTVDTFLTDMESSNGRHYRRKHKNKLYTYLSSSDEYVTMQLGIASSAGAFDWSSVALEPLRSFLADGFSVTEKDD